MIVVDWKQVAGGSKLRVTRANAASLESIYNFNYYGLLELRLELIARPSSHEEAEVLWKSGFICNQ